MAFYGPPAPFQLYAYPMPIPNHEIYAVYPSGGGGVAAAPLDGTQFYYEPAAPKSSYSGKHSFNRKESTDSGISGVSRKTSTNSNLSISSIIEESSEETIKEEPVYVEPDQDLCEKITQQVEFYFSDANITKDKFLLKHVKRNKEGYVSLKLISSFKRVKHLTKDWRQVAHAIKTCSKRLEVNDQQTKVRRLEDLPPYDETTPSRTVVVLNLPMERPTIEGVAEKFRVCGEIVLVRILRPGNPIPADIKQYVAKHPEMTTKVCALVEFERTEFAQKAVRDLNDLEDEEGVNPPMKVMELTATPLKNGNKKIEAKKLAEKAAAMAKATPQRKYSLQSTYNAPTMSMTMGRTRRISLMPNMKFGPIVEDVKENVMPRKEYTLNPNAPSFQMNADGSYHMIPMTMGQRRRTGNTVLYMDDGGYMSVPTRRISGQFSYSSSESTSSSGIKVPANVIRMPKGPEGKGFTNWCKTRMEKRPSRAIPIVAPPTRTVTENGEEGETAANPSTSKEAIKVPEITVEAASASESGSSEDEAVVPDKSESGDSGHEDSCGDGEASETEAHDYNPKAEERTR